jgi:hypothetical protein
VRIFNIGSKKELIGTYTTDDINSYIEDIQSLSKKYKYAENRKDESPNS